METASARFAEAYSNWTATNAELTLFTGDLARADYSILLWTDIGTDLKQRPPPYAMSPKDEIRSSRNHFIPFHLEPGEADDGWNICGYTRIAITRIPGRTVGQSCHLFQNHTYRWVAPGACVEVEPDAGRVLDDFQPLLGILLGVKVSPHMDPNYSNPMGPHEVIDPPAEVLPFGQHQVTLVGLVDLRPELLQTF